MCGLALMAAWAAAVEPDPPAPPAPDDAEPVPDLTRDDLRFLKPRHHMLESVPRSQTDFTAYTLEWGEAKIGLATVTVGLLPRVQVGTVPVLDVLDTWNVHAKVNAVRLGSVDLAVGGSYYLLAQPDWYATWRSAGVFASVIVARPWSLHAQASYATFGARGTIDLAELSPLLSQATGVELDEWEFQGTLQPEAAGQAVTVKFATDLRFNRRDSLVLQVGFVPWANARYDLGGDPPPVLGIDRMMDAGGEFPFEETYLASLSYQMTLKRVDVRMGGGVAALPGAWILQANDVSYRLGGKTRRTEARQRRSWRESRREADEQPVQSPVP